MSTKKKSDEPSYAELSGELETILDEIESGEIDLDELSDKVERAATLLSQCRKKLSATETKVTVVSARVPFGAFAVHGAYNITDTGDKVETASLGASYSFSKRTTILAVYQDREEADADFYQVGIRHSF